jgi:hypothetical protein
MTSSGILRKVFLDVFSRRTHKIFLRRVGSVLVTTNVVPISSILVTLMMEELSSSETSVLTRATRRNNLEDAILHSHLKSYKDFHSLYLTFV